MNSPSLVMILLGALVPGLLFACVTDWRERIIENKLNLAIAVAAPLYWWAAGLSLSAMGNQLGLGLIVTIIFAGLFAMNAMGGGDVKLIGALALWFPPTAFMTLLIAMSIFGGLLTIFMLVRQKWLKAEGQPEIPYGIAIAVAGLWSVYERYLNHFG
jgi:prepilin peptidase CpaA